MSSSKIQLFVSTAALCAALSPVALVQTASAQDAQSPSVSQGQPIQQLPTMEVRADDTYGADEASVGTKTDTPIMVTPMRVDVLTPQAIEDMGLQSQGFDQALATLGIAGKGMGDLGNVYFFRGFETTTTLWNGFRVEDMGSNASNGVNGGVWMGNVERLELLRGASAVLYGRAEPGGAINVVTRRPGDDFGGSLAAGVGSFENQWASVDLTGPLNADATLLYRLYVGHEQSDSWYTYGPDYRSTGVAPALEWRISPQTTLYFQGQFRDMEGGALQPYIPIDDATNTLLPIDPADTLMPGAQSEFRQRRAMIGIDHRFNDDWSLTWRYMYNNADNPLTVLSWAVGMTYPPVSSEIEYTRGLVTNVSGQEGHASLLELTGRFETGALRHTLLLGVDYYDTQSYQDADFDCWCNNFSYANPPPYTYNPADFSGAVNTWDLTEREVGFYAQDQIELPNNVHVLLGARYQRQKERSLFVAPGFFTEDLPYERSVFLPRAAILWQPNPALSLYYSYAENMGASQGVTFDGTPLDPEFARQHELGAKFDLLDGRLIAQTAVFELTKENIAAGDTAHPGFNIGVGRVRSTGFELSMQGQITDDWNVLATYNYARPYVEVGAEGASSLQPQAIVAGTVLPYFSQHSFSVLTSYNLPVEGWRIGAGYSWFSAPVMDQISVVDTEAYGVASAFTSYETEIGGRTTVFQLNIDNVFDEEYLLFQGDIGVPYAADPTLGFGYTGGNYVGGNWGQPRTVKFGVRVAF